MVVVANNIHHGSHDESISWSSVSSSQKVVNARVPVPGACIPEVACMQVH